MKRIAIIAILTVLCISGAQAQTFLDRLKKPTKDKAVVTITQDAAIDKLVNGNNATNATIGTRKDPTSNTKKKNAASNTATSNATSNTATPSSNTSASHASSTEEPDMSKKVMKNSYKVTGYRVQAFAGGNTRNDRRTAETVGNNIKRRFPEQPIYVHFYSPRWICRVGNFRTYEEAHAMLLEIREMGYKQASIVKGKISVQY
ncbi:MAG: SPOR domain-containing protein [Prevotella sp.]|nr:SPOR domain-containing protein [Prevotella sp.]MDD7029909.1 SPOR domain-containing protein [Prevotellaceae bacterium]MCI7579132.1 SPOR domain-containing protein [Prevotella sp.]MDD7074728.1 SPOR domain-containing protein [Prevotellaceae bacterium]MDY3251435.1 SPOR domain-containing protein [Prevotella sp.]